MIQLKAGLKMDFKYIIYPIIMSVSVLLYLVLITISPNNIWLSYIPISIAVAGITILEIYYPYRRDWRPVRSEIKTDFLFLLVVQTGLPLVLSLTMIHFFHTPISSVGSLLPKLWPHQLSILIQAGLMLLLAELGSYCVHRAAHRVPILWRFHAIHHSSEKLFSLNVSRFHPIEKIIQYCVVSVPFMLLAVNPEVIGLYFVFYAINGFFQHSNINLHYGILNYIVSSANLHRWHHSPEQYESNHNFGNNLIVWDIIFGTWYLPSHRNVNQVGLSQANFPQSFIKLFFKPFKFNNKQRL